MRVGEASAGWRRETAKPGKPASQRSVARVAITTTIAGIVVLVADVTGQVLADDRARDPAEWAHAVRTSHALLIWVSGVALLTFDRRVASRDERAPPSDALSGTHVIVYELHPVGRLDDDVRDDWRFTARCCPGHRARRSRWSPYTRAELRGFMSRHGHRLGQFKPRSHSMIIPRLLGRAQHETSIRLTVFGGNGVR